MLRDLFYTGAGLDRADRLRGDDAWVADALANEATQIVPIWQGQSLIRADGSPAAVTLAGAPAQDVLAIADEVVFLGLDGRTAFFAADLSEEQAPALAHGPKPAEFMDLRQAGPVMEHHQGALLAYARGLLHWHRRHRFCGDCGTPTESRQGGHIRVCTNPDCGLQHFPRTDPAVIMLVTRPTPAGEACLLAHAARFLPGMYSTLAGFVEPGESLEEAVAREVMEEAGVAVAEVRYRGSQPWPFPASLMIGFRAVAATAEIDFDSTEIEDAAWFTRADIARMEETGKRLPRLDSIARRLIEEWLAEDGG